MLRILVSGIVMVYGIQAQSDRFPLESVSIEGTSVPKEVVLDLADLRVGTPVDKASFDAAARRLADCGLFQSINYRYAPGPKRGYALTLQLADPTRFISASIDISGANQDELWRWLSSRYPSLNHKLPQNDAAQGFVSRELEQQLSAALKGHHVITRLESDFSTGRSLLSFQSDPLPQIATIHFTGQVEFTSNALAALIPKDVIEPGYLERSFRQAVELNLRRAYEEHGMYRVRFPSITAAPEPGWKVSITTSIEEGAKYKLGDVQILGDNLPLDAMRKAANFSKGELANWSVIQNSLWEMEKPVKRRGYLNAAAVPERLLDDDQRVLDLKVTIRPGPLYRFGQLQIAGLPPNLEAQARKAWTMKSGDPFDYGYPKDFFEAFFRTVDSRQFKKVGSTMQKGSDENVMDLTLSFEPR